jgi:hypothetical protein
MKLVYAALITACTVVQCSIMDDSAFLWEHATFGPPPRRNPLTDRYEILHQLIMSASSRDVPKMITIGSVGSDPHIRELYSYQKCLPIFLFVDKPTARTGIASSTIMHQLTQISQGSAFWGLEVCK